LVAEGEPARFQQRPDPEKETQHAKATLIEYDAAEERMVLQGNAHYWQGTDCLRGNRIVYYADRDLVEAQGDKEGKERVRITLLPGDAQPASATECVE
jgi:lipopolysaccharide export system protein LptA